MAAADEAVALVDMAAMHQFVASRSASPEQLDRLAAGDDTAAKKKKEMDEMKQGLIDALTKKCLALAAAIAAVRVLPIRTHMQAACCNLTCASQRL